MDKKEIVFRLEQLPGRVGFFYKNLQTGESFGLHRQEEFLAASVIKLPVYAVIMKLAAEGQIDLSEKLICREEDKLPPCGALYFFTGEVTVDIRTLCGLMISLSDNAATNLLLRRFGLDFLNEQFKQIGLEKTHLERLLFDGEAPTRGLENKIVPEDYVKTDEELAAESRGELMFANDGEDHIVENNYISVSWQDDGIHYNLMQRNGELSVDELIKMANEIIEYN